MTEKHGDTPLHIAADRNQAEAAAFLLKHGATHTDRNHNHLTALHVAVSKGNNDVLKVTIIVYITVNLSAFVCRLFHEDFCSSPVDWREIFMTQSIDKWVCTIL